VADVYQGEAYVLTVASVYGMFQPVPGNREDSYPTMHGVLDRLTPMVGPGSHVVVGGDFNSWRHSSTPSVHYEAVFDRFASIGMSDCIEANVRGVRNPMPNCSCSAGDRCTNVQTYRHQRRPDSNPW